MGADVMKPPNRLDFAPDEYGLAEFEQAMMEWQHVQRRRQMRIVGRQ